MNVCKRLVFSSFLFLIFIMCTSTLALAKDAKMAGAFHMDAGDRGTALFAACTGLGSSNEVVEHKVVDKSGHEIIRKIPGRLRWDDVVCSKPISSDLSLWEWRDLAVTGTLTDARVDLVTISMLGADGEALAVWRLTNAWPSSILGESGDGVKQAGVEELTLVHEGLYREQ